ncbi:hypothetical protein [Heterosigma akashiwo virus 01]|jgi:hypothetical protein|uniref:Uncharacterized protein n=1 Tax=Heterosigma akashiwo virus 01 TaxID=97195 RepID=A0A1C9C5A0_HAV01|nr:hypothetical protein D1R72_gp133 [Heterosigma akashiwo virus 01]AOM63464.1 hypothetical protein [Heterosigma akashiwo virus 01]
MAQNTIMTALNIVYIRNDIMSIQNGLTINEVYKMNYKKVVQYFKRYLASFVRTNVHIKIILRNVVDNGVMFFYCRTARTIKDNTERLIKNQCNKKWNARMLRTQKTCGM